ncbi:tRNA lysidine(34) synthetase TilS [Mycoplasma sp. E35C]|uniref:tRNA lysidine(34) synthetase TilS n=1 Tax=Mycoplasma sp. E35C TaxID=2801918 RepID=UPI001CA4527C|nr:tRNA lysidine(34) synthetase TilS [Mycoplasma sp. E35C]QZX49107.1 tRNA lysidine(34) synthetase TilS [Mycoplasma sp. E35C]
MNTTSNNKKYLIGVSGGPDSMYLLNQYKDQILVVCHVNYNKRASSLRDEIIVKNYCNKHNIKLEILSLDKNFNYTENFQAQARKLRYDFFIEISKKYQINDCLIAHQQDDFLESAIMQYSRNKDLLFYGLHEFSNYKNLKIHRPLLGISKKEIISFLEQNNIAYGIDESNFTPTYERNKIRLELSKLNADELLDKINFFINKNQENHHKYQQVQTFLDNWNYNYSDLIDFDDNQHVIYYWLSKNNINYSQNKAKAILEFIKKKNNKRYRLKANLFLIKSGSFLKIIKQ